MQDERDHREYKQQVDQPSRYVENRESAQPGYQQNNEQNRPDAHYLSLHFSKFGPQAFIRVQHAGRIAGSPGLPV